MPEAKAHIAVEVVDDPTRIDAGQWNALLQAQPSPTPFMRHEYLAALHASASASAPTGWAPQFLVIRDGAALLAACPLYLKTHSYGEYVFDWAWADAYERQGLRYYPKLLAAVPFTPVPGTRLLAHDDDLRVMLLQAMEVIARENGLSSAHVLFVDDADRRAAQAAGWMLRSGVQFHWHNRHASGATQPDASGGAQSPHGGRSRSHDGGGRPSPDRGDLPSHGPSGLPRHGSTGLQSHASAGSPSPASGVAQAPYADFADFLASLHRDKRKKIQQERRKVADAGIRFELLRGREIDTDAWDFFHRCYTLTYRAHHSRPYLTRDFFARMAHEMPDHWLMFVARRAGRRLACSLVALDDANRIAYGRYWGATEHVDCLHFEACYYQPLAWCIDHRYRRFEGGAQGEHKMARGLLPAPTASAHWLAHSQFADAVARFLEREGAGVEAYVDELRERNPFKREG
jgi:predicted N-acyltransferase